MNANIVETSNNIIKRVREYSGSSNNQAQTLRCVVKDVDASKLTVNIFIPLLSSTLYDVSIGYTPTNINGFIKALPNIGDEGIILFSSEQPPILISVLPSTKERSTVLSDEISIGKQSSQFKVDSNKNVLVRTKTVMDLLSDTLRYSKSKTSVNETSSKVTKDNYIIHNDKKIPYFSVEMKNPTTSNYEFSPENILSNDELEESIINSNKLLISKADNFISDVSSFLEAIDTNTTKDDILNFKNKMYNVYMDSDKSDDPYIKIEHGCSVANDNSVNDNVCYKISLNDNQGEMASLSFMKDRTIVINCSDVIINNNKE